MKIVDLSTALYDGMPVYDGDPAVRIATVRTRHTHGWELREMRLGTHTGTHVDAPIHMHDDGATLDDIPLSQFCGPARVARVGDGTFPPSIGLLFYESVPASCVPAILAAGPPFVGGPLETEAERQLLAGGVITYTDLVNVETLAGVEFVFYGFPLKVREGDGSPVRAVAVVSASEAQAA